MKQFFKLPKNTFVFSVKLQTNISFDVDLIIKLNSVPINKVNCIVQKEWFNPFTLNIFNFYLPKTQPSYMDNHDIGNILVDIQLLEKYEN